MPNEPAEQLSMEEMLKRSITHPELPGMGGVSTQNPAGYNPADVPDAASAYTQAWNAQFAQPEQPQQAQPQPPPPAPQEPPPPRDDRGRFTKMYAGKYRSPEELETGYIQSTQETQRIIAERDGLKAALALLNQQPQFRTREERPQPIKVNVPQEGEPFIDPAQLDSFVEQRARAVALQQIQDTLGPILKSNQALNNVRAAYPDYGQNEVEFTKWLSSNSDLASQLSQSPEIGMEYAYLKFLRERGALLAQAAQAQAAQTQPQLEQARQHAAPPNAGKSEPNENASRQKQLEELYRYGQQTGDWRPYQKYRLTEAIPSWHVKTDWGKTG